MSFHGPPLGLPGRRSAYPESASRPSWREHPLLASALDLLLPTPCRECGARPVGRLHLCPRCAARIRFLPRSTCRVCALRPGRVPGAACAPCVLDPPPWRRLFAVASYEPPLDGVIRAFKHGGDAWLADCLADLAFDAFTDDLRLCDLVLPLPMHWARRWRRGFDQSARLAERLSRRLALPCASGLRSPLRRRWGPPLSRLRHADRQRQARRALAIRQPAATPARRSRPRHSWLASLPSLPALPAVPAVPAVPALPARSLLPWWQPCEVEGRSLLLVDDVLTTGATARQACRLLLRLGASDVAVLVIARTPAEPGAAPAQLS